MRLRERFLQRFFEKCVLTAGEVTTSWKRPASGERTFSWIKGALTFDALRQAWHRSDGGRLSRARPPRRLCVAVISRSDNSSTLGVSAEDTSQSRD